MRTRRWTWRTVVASITVTALLGLGLTPPVGALVLPQRSEGSRGHVPGPPTHLRATLHRQRVTLHWRAPATGPAAGVPRDYLVIWVAPPELPLTARVDTHSLATSYVSPFGAGTYEVEAKNAVGTSAPSAPVTVAEAEAEAEAGGKPGGLFSQRRGG